MATDFLSKLLKHQSAKTDPSEVYKELLANHMNNLNHEGEYADDDLESMLKVTSPNMQDQLLGQSSKEFNGLNRADYEADTSGNGAFPEQARIKIFDILSQLMSRR